MSTKERKDKAIVNDERRKRRMAGRLVTGMNSETYSGVPYTTTRDAALKGQLPVVKIGRRFYFDKADLDRWIDNRKERLTQ